MSVIACIPVRYGSTRLPGKPLIEINGLPLVLHVAKRASMASLFDELIVLTDDERIAELVTQHGYQVAMTKTDCASGSDRIVDYIEQGHAGDVFVNIQGDELLLNPEHIDTLIRSYDGNQDVVTIAHQSCDPITINSPSTAKIVTDKTGNAMYFSRQAIPLQQSGELAASALIHIGIYLYTRDAICEFSKWPQAPLEKIEKLEQLRFLENNVPIKIVEVEHSQSLSIDTVKDLEQAEAFFQE